MSRNREHDGTHATHCCWLHGCKYSDDDCPVITGDVKQAYGCEDCGDQGWETTPPQELKEIDRRVGDWMARWFDDKEEEVAKEIYLTRDPAAIFWFVGKLGACHRLGSVWKMVQMVNKLEKGDQ